MVVMVVMKAVLVVRTAGVLLRPLLEPWVYLVRVGAWAGYYQPVEVQHWPSD
jgi:hypothetical protein